MDGAAATVRLDSDVQEGLCKLAKRSGCLLAQQRLARSRE
jgi:hypothetical protein